MVLAVPVCAGKERILQHPARTGQVARLAVQLGEQMSRGEYLRVVLARGHRGRFERALQQRAGAVEVAAVATGYGVGSDSRKGRRRRHRYTMPYLREGLPPHLK